MELKFRAWDKEQNVILSWGELMDVQYNERWFLENRDKNYVSCIFTDSSLILMQYTGLKDKNGKEIYFGDLMSNNFGSDKEVIRLIVDHEGWMAMKRIKGNSSLPKYISLFEFHKLNFEIIGNIHEDKLEDKC